MREPWAEQKNAFHECCTSCMQPNSSHATFLPSHPLDSLPSTTACTTGLVAGPFGAAIGFFVGKNAGQGKAEQKAAAARLGLTPEVMLAIEELDSEVVATRADYELVQGARESARRRLKKLQSDAVRPKSPNPDRKQGKYWTEAPCPRPQTLLKRSDAPALANDCTDKASPKS